MDVCVSISQLFNMCLSVRLLYSSLKFACVSIYRSYIQFNLCLSVHLLYSSLKSACLLSIDRIYTSYKHTSHFPYKDVGNRNTCGTTELHKIKNWNVSRGLERSLKRSSLEPQQQQHPVKSHRQSNKIDCMHDLDGKLFISVSPERSALWRPRRSCGRETRRWERTTSR